MSFVNEKSVAGFGVIRNSPWDFAGIFPTEQEAKAKAAEMGDGYEVHWGENQEGTDNFVTTAIFAPLD